MLGTDYEVFVNNSKTGKPVPAGVFGLTGKTGKHLPMFIDAEDVGSVHRDNLMLEVCTHPAATGKEFAKNVRQTMLAVTNFVKSFDESYYISNIPAANFTDEDLSTREAKDIGCDIDFVSIALDSCPRDPVTAKNLKGSRFSGGHVHISYDMAIAPPWVAAMLCDVFIGIPQQHKLNKQRAKFYGLATLHRPTQYPDGSGGVEYRVLDSFWVHQPDLNVISSLELVQSLLVPDYVDCVRQIVELHMRELAPKAIIAEIPNADKIVKESLSILAKFAPKLMP
jgi:hypothetical protein